MRQTKISKKNQKKSPLPPDTMLPTACVGQILAENNIVVGGRGATI